MLVTNRPQLYLKIAGQPEFNIADRVEGLEYLGPGDDDSGPAFTNTYEEHTGIDGQTFVSQNFDKRTMNEKFFMRFSDYYDFVLAKHQLYQLFGRRDLIRVRCDSNPYKVYYGYPTTFNVAPTQSEAHYTSFTIPFDNPDGYRYSIFPSDSMPKDSAQFGMGFQAASQLQYHFTSTSFTLYNPSDITVDPYEERHELKISVKYSGGNIKITNTTTNTEFQYKKATNSTLILDGINAMIDNNNVNIDSDFGYITLAPGNNAFSITGASNVDITFSFPFIYLS